MVNFVVPESVKFFVSSVFATVAGYIRLPTEFRAGCGFAVVLNFVMPERVNRFGFRRKTYRTGVSF